MRAPQDSANTRRSSAPASSRTPPVRTGDDQRRRGWFWHWNTIITQFSPLIGLKGVGLLNSYTVWTDQRADSPYRGYAFPSQQAEAAFYGEDRAELITINKILVALDLIEIRKEMVTRVDEAGRRWRVPHNFYRVKDRGEGFTLTLDAVIRVLELAATDDAVYRYIRHIFSARFTPIDRDNIWHRLLPALRTHPLWQALSARAAEEEARASARTRAGHRRRQRQDAGIGETTEGEGRSAPHDGVHAAPSGTTATDPLASGKPATIVALTNCDDCSDGGGSNSAEQCIVAQTNNAHEVSPSPIALSANSEACVSVAQSTRTYEQTQQMRTTKRRGYDQGQLDGLDSEMVVVPPVRIESSSNATDRVWQFPNTEKASPQWGDTAETDDTDSGSGHNTPPVSFDAVVACYEAANGRAASPLERELLAELVEAFSAVARTVGESGERWVIAAIREAVSSGSAFVAPKRIREILNRWATRQSSTIRPGAGEGGNGLPRPVNRESQPRGTRAMSRTRESPYAGIGQCDGDGEHGFLLADEALVARLSAALSAALGTPLRVTLAPSPSSDEDSAGHVSHVSDARPSTVSMSTPPPRVPEGLTLPQLWAMALETLRERLSPLQFETVVRPAALIGLEDDGTLVVGAPNQMLCRRLQQVLPVVQVALEEVLGRPVSLTAVVAQEWLEGDVRG